MSEASPHAVDAPLTKTLVALKRVRSLRDPCTNSLIKRAVEAANFDASSIHGLMMELSKPGNRLGEEIGIDGNDGIELEQSYRVSNARGITHRRPSIVKIRGLNPARSKLAHRARQDRSRRSVESTGVHRLVREQLERHVANVSSAAPSRLGSPCLSVSEPRTNCSWRSVMGLNDLVGSNFSGCGISYCWSGSALKHHRNSNFYSDSDGQEQPLLSSAQTEKDDMELMPYLETPRSLSQKFRPRNFCDLVGLNVVSQSLLHAACKGKIAPMYLFHGPRGTGKTATAQIFAAALNCLSLEEERPCGYCRECVFLFSGRSKNVKEINARKIDRAEKVKALLKSASLVPYSSRFKVFIIDECQALGEDVWPSILKSLDEPYRHTVYIMITSDLDELPRASVSHCQKFHFPKVKVTDIVHKLRKICIDEGLDFDQDGLCFIAAKSNGSLRDAETMLDQLGLLGKRITISLVHELVGSASDDELIELLDLALSSDTTNTVKRARDLMGSSIDPLQLVSQMANLIMDILAGRCQSGDSEISKNFFGRYALAEIGMQKLRHALRILSETEKQLRTSKNQATWVTVALLQFGTGESSPIRESIDHVDCRRFSYLKDPDDCAQMVRVDGSSICHACNNSKSKCLERHCRRLKLEIIWKKAIGKCRHKLLRSFLKKEGCLSSVHVTEELAVAQVGFSRPEHLIRAEEHRDMIRSSLQHVLGCNVELKLELMPMPMRKDAKGKRQSFSLLSCSGRKQDLSDATDVDEVKRFGGYSSCRDGRLSLIARRLEVTSGRGVCEDNSSSVVAVTSDKSISSDMHNTYAICRTGQSRRDREPDTQPNCFSKTMKFQRRLFSSDAAQTICLRVQPSRTETALPKKAYEAYFRSYDPYDQYSRSNSRVTHSSKEDDVSTENTTFRTKMLCWKAPRVPSSR